MKKKALSAAAVFMLAATIFAQSESDFEVRQNADNTLTITKYTGTAKDVVIPSTLHGLRVTIIGSEAFYENNLTSVVIPNTVTDIEKSAFYGNKLTEISLPVSLKEIGQGAFRHNKIRTLVIPDGVTLISSLDRHIPQEYIQGLGWRNKAEAYTHNGAFADNPIEFLSIPASLSKESSVKLSKLYDEIAFATDGDVYKTTAGIDIRTFGVNTPAFIIIPADMDENNMTVNFEGGLVNFWKSQNKAAGGYIYRHPLWARVSAAEANKFFQEKIEAEQKAAREKREKEEAEIKAAQEAEQKAAARREVERQQAAAAFARAAEAEKRRVKPAFGIYVAPGTIGGTNGWQILTGGVLAGFHIGNVVNILGNAEGGFGWQHRLAKNSTEDKYHFPRNYNIGGIFEISLLKKVCLGFGGGMAVITNRAKLIQYEETSIYCTTRNKIIKEKLPSLSFPYIRGTIGRYSEGCRGAMIQAFYDYNFKKNGFKLGILFGVLS